MIHRKEILIIEKWELKCSMTRWKPPEAVSGHAIVLRTGIFLSWFRLDIYRSVKTLETHPVQVQISRETNKAPNSSTSSQLQSILLDRDDRSPGVSEPLDSMIRESITFK